jgi:Zn-dependent M28 family amino/carboxypeptidase
LYVLYSLAICIPFVIVALGINALLHLITNDFFLLYWGTFLPTMALPILIFTAGKPNPHTVNDNTSGVITLCEIWAAMTEQQRAKTAFVFFDNEENGLLGSAYFRNLHKKDGLDKKLMINFDCVSDGEHMLFVLNKPALKNYGEAFAAAFPSTDDHTVWLESASNTLYPSDQGNFPVSAGVAALKKKKGIGLYMNRIHTPKDTVLQEQNISYLTAGTLALIDKIRSV